MPVIVNGVTYLTPIDVAEKLCCSRENVLRYVRAGRLTAYHLGTRRVLIHPDDFRVFALSYIPPDRVSLYEPGKE